MWDIPPIPLQSYVIEEAEQQQESTSAPVLPAGARPLSSTNSAFTTASTSTGPNSLRARMLVELAQRAHGSQDAGSSSPGMPDTPSTATTIPLRRSSSSYNLREGQLDPSLASTDLNDGLQEEPELDGDQASSGSSEVSSEDGADSARGSPSPPIPQQFTTASTLPSPQPSTFANHGQRPFDPSASYVDLYDRLRRDVGIDSERGSPPATPQTDSAHLPAESQLRPGAEGEAEGGRQGAPMLTTDSWAALDDPPPDDHMHFGASLTRRLTVLSEQATRASEQNADETPRGRQAANDLSWIPECVAGPSSLTRRTMDRRDLSDLTLVPSESPSPLSSRSSSANGGARLTRFSVGESDNDRGRVMDQIRGDLLGRPISPQNLDGALPDCTRPSSVDTDYVAQEARRDCIHGPFLTPTNTPALSNASANSSPGLMMAPALSQRTSRHDTPREEPVNGHAVALPPAVNGNHLAPPVPTMNIPPTSLDGHHSPEPPRLHGPWPQARPSSTDTDYVEQEAHRDGIQCPFLSPSASESSTPDLVMAPAPSQRMNGHPVGPREPRMNGRPTEPREPQMNGHPVEPREPQLNGHQTPCRDDHPRLRPAHLRRDSVHRQRRRPIPLGFTHSFRMRGASGSQVDTSLVNGEAAQLRQQLHQLQHQFNLQRSRSAPRGNGRLPPSLVDENGIWIITEDLEQLRRSVPVDDEDTPTGNENDETASEEVQEREALDLLRRYVDMNSLQARRLVYLVERRMAEQS